MDYAWYPTSIDLFFIFLLTKLGELKLGELLDTPPPGLDEAMAIAKVCFIFVFRCSFHIVSGLSLYFMVSLLKIDSLAGDAVSWITGIQYVYSNSFWYCTHGEHKHQNLSECLEWINRYSWLLFTGPYIATFVLARLPGCIHWQDIEGRNTNMRQWKHKCVLDTSEKPGKFNLELLV